MIQHLLSQLQCLPREEQLRVIRRLNNSYKSILQRMDDDIFGVVIDLLDVKDRVSLLCALHERPTPRATATTILERQLASRALLEALCVQSLSRGIAYIADKVLFSVPSCFCISRTFVFADWTPFRSKKTRCVASVRWCASSPHARCDVKSGFLREFSKTVVRRQAFAVRLTAHVEQWDAHPGVCHLIVDKRPTAIFVTPIHVVLWNVFRGAAPWVDAAFMQTRLTVEGAPHSVGSAVAI